MALNPNHSFEDLGDTKCAIIEKNCTPQRVAFLKDLLEYNNFKVVVVDSPPPKAVKPAAAPKAAAPADGETTAPSPTAAPAATVPMPDAPAPTPAATSFTVGVTDVTFSPTNAIFNRELKNQAGDIVTPDYWYQKEVKVRADEWYWKK